MMCMAGLGRYDIPYRKCCIIYRIESFGRDNNNVVNISIFRYIILNFDIPKYRTVSNTCMPENVISVRIDFLIYIGIYGIYRLFNMYLYSIYFGIPIISIYTVYSIYKGILRYKKIHIVIVTYQKLWYTQNLLIVRYLISSGWEHSSYQLIHNPQVKEIY